MRLMSLLPHTRSLALLGLAVSTMALSACGGTATSVAGGALVNVTERDFRVSAPKRVAAGDLTLQVHNRGPVAHELIVVRSDHALPMRSDGLTVDEDAVERSERGALEPVGPGVHELTVHLDPGRYILFCNMQGHYLGGMHTVLTVQ